MFETGPTLHPAQRELKNLLDLGIIKRRQTVEKNIRSQLLVKLVEADRSIQKPKSVG
jgi:predicted transcriptional regulator